MPDPGVPGWDFSVSAETLQLGKRCVKLWRAGPARPGRPAILTWPRCRLRARMTIRAALGELRERGLITIVVGKGSYLL
jgi:hypothetical protein